MRLAHEGVSEHADADLLHVTGRIELRRGADPGCLLLRDGGDSTLTRWRRP